MSAQNNISSKSRLLDTFRAQDGLITGKQARELGISPSMIARRVKSGEWAKVFPGVFRTTTAPESWHQTLLAACLYGGEEALISHLSAGAVWGLDGLSPGPIEILTTRRLRSPGVRVHRVAHIPSTDRRVARRLAVTSVERTLVDLAGRLNEEELEIALDSALRLRLTAVPRVERRLASSPPSAAGRGVLSRLLNERRASLTSESPLETKLMRAIRRSSLPQPVSQHRVMDGTRFVGRFDLAYPEAKVIIEVDGYRWHSGRAAWQKDRRRDNDLNRLGWTVLRFTAEDLKEPDAVIRQIKDALWPRLGPTIAHSGDLGP